MEEDVKAVVAHIPIGVTPKGWEILRDNKDLALKYIDECIEACNKSVSEVNSSNDSREVYVPYFKSCLRELNRIKGNL